MHSIIQPFPTTVYQTVVTGDIIATLCGKGKTSTGYTLSYAGNVGDVIVSISLTTGGIRGFGGGSFPTNVANFDTGAGRWIAEFRILDGTETDATFTAPSGAPDGISYMYYRFRKAVGTFSNDNDDDFNSNTNTPPTNVSSGTDRLSVNMGVATSTDAVTATDLGFFDVEDSAGTFNASLVMNWQTDFVGAGAVTPPNWTKVGTNAANNSIIFF